LKLDKPLTLAQQDNISKIRDAGGVVEYDRLGFHKPGSERAIPGINTAVVRSLTAIGWVLVAVWQPGFEVPDGPNRLVLERNEIEVRVLPLPRSQENAPVPYWASELDISPPWASDRANAAKESPLAFWDRATPSSIPTREQLVALLRNDGVEDDVVRLIEVCSGGAE